MFRVVTWNFQIGQAHESDKSCSLLAAVVRSLFLNKKSRTQMSSGLVGTSEQEVF